MKKFKSLKVSVSMLMVVLLVSMLFVSCGGGSMSCSLEGIQLSTDGESEIMFEVSVDDMSKEKIEQTQAISSALNNAIKDRPDLALMLKGESVDDGTDTSKSAVSNDYIYKGSDHFFQTLQSFADTNYPKATRMFPEMTCEEFYYYSAIGYAVANYNPNLFEISYVEFLESTDVKTFTPTFDQITSCGFWTSYYLKRFDGLELTKQSDNQYSNPTSLDSYATMRTAIMVQIALKESLRTGDIPVGKRMSDDIIIISHYLTNFSRDSLKNVGMKRVSLDEDDYFSQIGNVSVYLNLLLKHFADGEDFEVKLGHLAAASSSYLKALSGHMHGGAHNSAASAIAAEICHSNFECVETWGRGNIPGWGEGIPAPTSIDFNDQMYGEPAVNWYGGTSTSTMSTGGGSGGSTASPMFPESSGISIGFAGRL